MCRQSLFDQDLQNKALSMLCLQVTYLKYLQNKALSMLWSQVTYLKYPDRACLNSVDPDHMPQNVTSDQGLYDCTTLCYTDPLIISPLSSQYDLNNIERDVKHQTIIVMVIKWTFKF